MTNKERLYQFEHVDKEDEDLRVMLRSRTRIIISREPAT